MSTTWSVARSSWRYPPRPWSTHLPRPPQPLPQTHPRLRLRPSSPLLQRLLFRHRPILQHSRRRKSPSSNPSQSLNNNLSRHSASRPDPSKAPTLPSYNNVWRNTISSRLSCRLAKAVLHGTLACLLKTSCRLQRKADPGVPAGPLLGTARGLSAKSVSAIRLRRRSETTAAAASTLEPQSCPLPRCHLTPCQPPTPRR